MQHFTVVDLTAQCEVRQKAAYAYQLLEKLPGAAELIGACTSVLWRDPEQGDVQLKSESPGLVLRWRACSPTAGIATIRDGSWTLGVSLLASGIDADADLITLQTFQQHIFHELHDTGYEPSLDLARVAERPLLASMSLKLPEQAQDRWLFGVADRCFAAAYFRKLSLI